MNLGAVAPGDDMVDLGEPWPLWDARSPGCGRITIVCASCVGDVGPCDEESELEDVLGVAMGAGYDGGWNCDLGVTGDVIPGCVCVCAALGGGGGGGSVSVGRWGGWCARLGGVGVADCECVGSGGGGGSFSRDP